MRVFCPWTREWVEIGDKIVYKKGDYKIVKRFDKFFDHIHGDVIISQRCASDKEMIDGLESGASDFCAGEADQYFRFERPTEAYKKGLEAVEYKEVA